jgi:TENA/THI-4/PQQC family protein
VSRLPAVDDVVEALRAEVAGVEGAIRSHRFLAALEAGAVDRERLREFAGAQRAIIASDRRSFAQLAARFPAAPAGDLFLALAQGEGEALGRLAPLCAALGADAAWLAAYEPPPGVQAYPAFLAWLALNGSRADAALALLVNLDAWGANCNRAAAALRARYRLGEEAVGFFRFFGEPSPALRRSALAVLGDGLAEGDSEARARWAARTLQACELAFWDTMGDEAPGGRA